MLYLLQTLSFWWLAALALGVVAGLFSRRWSGAPLLAFLFALGAIAAYLHLLRGKYGFALETALLALASYAIGCAFGGLMRAAFGKRPAPPQPEAPAAARPDPKPAEQLGENAVASPLPSDAVAVAAAVVAQQFSGFPQQNAAQPAPVVSPAIPDHLAVAAASAVAQHLLQSAAATPPQAAAQVPEDLAAAAAGIVAERFLRATKPTPVNDDHPDAAPVLAEHLASAAASPPPRQDRPDKADRLSQIEGFGDKVAARLNGLGIWRFNQIAAWTPEQARWIGAELGEPGRVERENWIGQAKLLARGEEKPGRPPGMDRPEQPEDEDNLHLIRGIDLTLSHELHEIGIWRFAQIAAWSDDHVDWISEHFHQMAPVAARFWPPQARLLAAGALTDHARAVLSGESPVTDDGALSEWIAGLPRPSAAGAGDSLYAGARPPGFAEPVGERDDLTQIAGVDAAMAARLNGLGIWSLRQIAHWSPDNIRWIGAWLATPGAPERGNWVAQARALVLADSSTT